MKGLRYLCVVWLCCWQIAAPGQGIVFREGNLPDALKEARDAGKPVLVNFTATWCTPCKELTTEVFALPEISKYFNERFICVQVDVDKNKELVQQYKINGMPALVFLNEEGKEAGKIIGKCDISVLMHQAKVITGNKPTLNELWNDYKKNKSDVKIQQRVLREFPLYLASMRDQEDIEWWQGRMDKLFKVYWDTKPRAEFLNKEDLCLILLYCNQPIKNNQPIEYVIGHYDEYAEMLPPYTIISFFANYMNTLIMQLAKSGDVAYKGMLVRLDGDLKPVFDSVRTRSLPVRFLMKSKADAFYALYGRKDQKEYIAQVQVFLDKMGDMAGWEEYNDAVMNLLTAAEKKLKSESAKQALLWLDKLLTFKVNVDQQALFISSMGDCYLALENNEKAKECYNQAYLMSFQTQNIRVQNYLRQKMNALTQ